jgi:hypothetical protein
VTTSFVGLIFQGRSSNDAVARIQVLMEDQDAAGSAAILVGVKNDKNLAVRSQPLEEARVSVGGDTVAVVICGGPLGPPEFHQRRDCCSATL